MWLAYLQHSNWHNKTSPSSRQQKIASSGSLSRHTEQQKAGEANQIVPALSSKCQGSGNLMLQGNTLWIFWVRIQKFEFWASDDNGLYHLYCGPRGRYGIRAPKPWSQAGQLFAGWSTVLAQRSCVCQGLCQPSTGLFVCFHRPCKQFALRPGEQANGSRAKYTHMLPTGIDPGV